MPQVVFLFENAPAKRTVTAARGTSALEAARRAGVEIRTPCGGSGMCGKCRVRVKGETVLACQYRVVSDTEITVPKNRDDDKTLRILTDGQSFTHDRAPFITKRFSGGTTRVYGGADLIGSEDGDTSEETYGLALDIGTTTLVLSLVDLAAGKTLASESSINPQTRYAQDVLGRIRFAAKEERGLAVLHNALLGAVNAMLDSLLQKTGVKRERIYEAVYAGNTTMLHLAAGVETAPLGQYPYTPLLAGAEYRGAAALNISPFGRVWFPPFVSAWVGADIVSGMLALRLDEKKGVTLFIDIGTNGEMVLARDGKLAASSTAAGPAFEGMNIRCGMRAGRGAIDSFTIEGDECVFTVIGGGEAEGICGSGLFDIAGELARTGVVEKNGRFAGPEKTGGRLGARLLPPPEEPSPQGGASPDTKGGKIAFYITGTVYISQKDIRQIQLAKGAIRCGIDMLLSRFGLAPSGVDAVEIAGSFGYHLRETSLLDTGLLPPEFAGKITFAGNTSLAGAAAFLLNRHFRGRMRNLAAAVETVELADDPAFEKNFVRCLAFPDKRSGGPEGKADA